MRIEGKFRVVEVEPRHESEMVHLVSDPGGRAAAQFGEGKAKIMVTAHGALLKLTAGDEVKLTLEKKDPKEGAPVEEVLGPEVMPTEESFKEASGTTPPSLPEPEELAKKDRGENPLGEDERPDPVLYPDDTPRLQELPPDQRPPPNETSFDGGDLPKNEPEVITDPANGKRFRLGSDGVYQEVDEQDEEELSDEDLEKLTDPKQEERK
jgi:hypothetical protein